MTKEEFNNVVEHRIEVIRESLSIKANQYATPADRLHNFKQAALVDRSNPAEVLFGFMLKHWVGITDLVKYGKADLELYDERIKDLINYLILLDALIHEANKTKPSTSSSKEVRS